MNIELKSICSFKDIIDDINEVKDEFGQIQNEHRQKIGYIRADHDGYRWWTTYFPCREELKTEEIKMEIHNICAGIIESETFKNVEAIKTYCFNNPSDDVINFDRPDEYQYYIEGDLCYYWVRFITRKKDYNMYLTVYKKP